MDDEKKQASLAVEYLGGYEDKKKAPGFLNFYETYVSFKELFKQPLDIPYDEITNISVEPPEEVGKRVTMTRLVALGVFSLFFKKSKKEAFIVIELEDGSEIIFQSMGKTHIDIRSQLSSTLAQLKAA